MATEHLFKPFKGSEEQCIALVNYLNTLMPGVVKFTYSYSTEKVVFLDLEISLVDGKIETNLYIKPSNSQIYLDYHSNHPEHTKSSIPYSQALRVIERCSRQGQVDLHLENLREKLKEKNYPEEMIEENFTKAKKKDRKGLIFQERKKKSQNDEKTRLIFTFNKNNPPIHSWIRQGKKILNRNEKAKDIGRNIQITSKQPKNLQRIVTGLKEGGGGSPPPAGPPGCHKCPKNCHACPIIKEGSTFQSSNTKKIHSIRKHFTCDSSFIIYLGTCKRFKGQYIGKSTRPFKRRHSGHKQEIKNRIGGLGHHYGGENGCGYKNLTIQVIDQVEQGNHQALSDLELYWQHQLRCFVENGANGHCYKKEFT